MKIRLSNDGIVLNDGLNIKSFSLTDLNVKSLKNAIIDTKGNYWVLTGEGLFKYDGNNWTNLGGSYYQMTFDKEANLWLFGFNNSKFYFSKYDGNSFYYYNLDSILNGEWNNLTAMSVDCHNNKWIGCYNGGLVVFNENGINSESINIINDTTKLYKISIIKCYPNPMRNSTQFKFNIQDESNIRLTILDIHGNKIKTIAEGMHQPGNYSFDWNGCNEQGNLLSNGMYFYQLDINGRKEVGKVMVVR